ncbi:CRISPR-associated protein Cas4 [Halorhodospira halochloris]|uniref:CRISPR-associated protein Cas4 n=1 Tax=Halorhodospira halochloris TaxID=1052 RepID=UPI001EE8CB00|nr:CRISPR-associated protein Cas4 [Halorhodospira halochloris]MCG5549269.1 CRISPR-associated protein Cas4 [Halorhodospira halochloris]
MSTSKCQVTNTPAGDAADLIPLSALQHYLYCPRQCALIHVEGQWSENRYTVEGHILHQRTDEGRKEKRRGVRTVSAMPIRSTRLGVTGITDVVEFHAGEAQEKVFPVEYKRGRPKSHEADEVQLCAQALCLEEMLDTAIPEGALFYGQRRRRKTVTFRATLRERTADIAEKAREMISCAYTPTPVYSAKLCRQCSLLEICQPQPLTGAGSVRDWLLRQIEE